MPLGMVWPFTVVVPLETVTVPRAVGMLEVPVYCTLPSGPNW